MLLLLVTTISISAQKVDFTTYDVVAKAGDVSVIVKDNDYRMVVGSVKKPKLNMLMGYSKEQALIVLIGFWTFRKRVILKRTVMCLYVV